MEFHSEVTPNICTKNNNYILLTFNKNNVNQKTKENFYHSRQHSNLKCLSSDGHYS